ncbi:MAG: NAD/NADP octopine/nopaline dehydrogenase family protein, partial [Clostridium sp.]
PSFMVEDIINEITSHAKKGAVVGVIPSFGSKEEYYIDDLINKGCIFFGSQRVPSITRLITYGKSISLKQKNTTMKLGVIPQEYADKVCSDMTALIDIPCTPFNNYLDLPEVSYTPLMHPSKLYELFSDYSDNMVYKKIPLFYEEWGDDASAMLLQLNEDLKRIFFELKQLYANNISDFEKLKSYFNIQTPDQLTQKIRTSPSFSPEINSEKSHLPNTVSKYFMEDLLSGLCLLKSFSELLFIEVSTLDKVIYWAQELLQKDYIDNGKLCGVDIQDLTIPQVKGITSKEDLLNLII